MQLSHKMRRPEIDSHKEMECVNSHLIVPSLSYWMKRILTKVLQITIN